MTSLNKIQDEFENNKFDLEHESKMVQSRILSPIIEAIEENGLTQEELSERTGLRQPFISAILNIRKKLNMEHIALFQKALGIIIQPPQALSINEHKHKYYNKEEYEISTLDVFEEVYHSHFMKNLQQYAKSEKKVEYTSKRFKAVGYTKEINESFSDYESKEFAI